MLNRYEKRICKYCGDEFIPIRKNQAFCGDKCRNADRQTAQPIIKCRICGKLFQRKQKAQKYCSFECSEIAVSQQRIKYADYKRKSYENKKCIYCGKEFTPIRDDQVTCGAIECQKHLSLDRRMTYKKCKYQKNEGIEVAVVKKKKKYTIKEWNSLSPSERWEKMTLNEVAAENLKYHIPTYGKSETMARQGELPDDYGKRERKVKQCQQ